MKRCPKGHLYPDLLDSCPVCNKQSEFQTVLGSKDVIEKNIPDPLDISSNDTNSIDHIHIDRSEKKDSDETVFLGNHGLENSHVLVGWLIELDSTDNPLNSYPIFSDTELKIGRNQDNDVVFENKTVSRYHCTIKYEKLNIIIIDNNSSNGTVVDSKLIKSLVLTNKNSILIGEIKCRVKYL